jgi:hypothetical protein
VFDEVRPEPKGKGDSIFYFYRFLEREIERER